MNKLHYQISQQHDDKPFLVLIHGLFGSLENLFSVKRDLQNTLNIISIDLPDHGKSLRTEQFSFVEYAQHIRQLLAEIHITQPHILGHSLGGKVAMQLALSYPDEVASLIIADIAPVAYEPRHHKVIQALQRVDLQQITSRSEADNIMSEFIVEPGVRQFLLKSLVQQGQSWQWRFNLTRLVEDYDKLSAGLDTNSQFSKPVLFIKGGQSDYLSAKHQDIITTLFPKSQAKIISSAGHWLHAENPRVFNRLVERFLTPMLDDF